MKTKEFTIKRYDFNKIFISEGILTIHLTGLQEGYIQN